MLVLSNQCGNGIQNGRDIAANIIPSPIETIIKSISQAINLSIQRASTIASVFDAAGDDDSRLSVNQINNLSHLSIYNIWKCLIIIPCWRRLTVIILDYTTYLIR
jgi:hypothetical protein